MKLPVLPPSSKLWPSGEEEEEESRTRLRAQWHAKVCIKCFSQSIIINLIPRLLCDEANDQYALPYLFSSLTSN